MNVRRVSHLGGFLPTRAKHFGATAADVPWDQLIQAGTAITTSAIDSAATRQNRKNKKKRKKAAEEQIAVETAPVPVARPVPWGPILLLVGVLGGAVILSGGRKK